MEKHGLPVHQPDRRAILRLGGGVLLGAALAACGSSKDSGDTGAGAAAAPTATANDLGRLDTQAFTPTMALDRLKEGNTRFVAGSSTHPDQSGARRAALAAGQHPFAQILACADSRVSPELVFDQGLGDIFVTRSAGQVIDHAVLGTVQFGVGELKTPLVVVLGHRKCGAVKATVEAIEKKVAASGTDIDALVAAIRPAVEKAEATKPSGVLDAAIEFNVANEVARLSAAPVLSGALKEGKLQVVGAVYDVSTGTVTFA
jgi:carbonic anhydrase